MVLISYFTIHETRILEEYVPVDCEVWELYLLLCKICDIVFAPSFSLPWISYLDSLVHDFYFLFVSLAPEKNIPKCNFLLHYPRHMMKFGPLRFLWYMRFEAYHQRIKRITRSQNFKNVCFTVANRIQFLKCLKQQDFRQCLCDPPELHGTKTLNLSMLPTALHEKLHALKSGLETAISVKEIQCYSECYKLGDVHVVDVINEAYVFSKINFIVKIGLS